MLVRAGTEGSNLTAAPTIRPPTRSSFRAAINAPSGAPTNMRSLLAGQFYLGGAEPTLVGPSSGWFNAINVSNGVFNWRNHLDLPANGGALVMNYTPLPEGNASIVFTGLLNGRFAAFDGKSGKLLWQYDTGAVIWAPPATFAENGERYVWSRRRGRHHEGAGTEGDHRSEHADGIRFRQAKTSHEVAGGHKQWQRRRISATIALTLSPLAAGFVVLGLVSLGLARQGARS